jgi:hypothetical protein
MHVILAGAFDELVHQTEIALPFLRLDPVPGNTGQDGVHVDLAGEQRPHHLHALRVGRNGVAQLAAEHQEGLAIDDQLRGLSALFQMRDGRGYGLGLCACHQGQRARQQCAGKKPCLDHVLLFQNFISPTRPKRWQDAICRRDPPLRGWWCSPARLCTGARDAVRWTYRRRRNPISTM